MCVHVCVGMCMCVNKVGGGEGKGGRRKKGGVGEHNNKVGVATYILVMQVRGKEVHTCM